MFQKKSYNRNIIKYSSTTSPLRLTVCVSCHQPLAELLILYINISINFDLAIVLDKKNSVLCLEDIICIIPVLHEIPTEHRYISSIICCDYF